ncbi:MAG TPA: peptide chain release factor N(5)-glutamine methyltransferase [Rhodothermales bacterium]|nr:peptide chain release factor N(5)-glutamine methyltransferase [Rhodothermales bacterium]
MDEASRTCAALLRHLEATLEMAGVDEARRSAEWIAEEATGQRRALLYAYPDRPVDAETWARAEAMVARRAAGEPLQYVVGHVDFRGLRLAVAPGVLIPRPETEELVDHVLGALKGVSAPRVLDAGTGSGCLALALKAAHPDARVTALDVSPDALRIARANAAALGLDVVFVQADLLSPGLPVEGPFDLIVSNPPYIPDAEACTLDSVVLDHEPHVALFSGADPLTFYHTLARHGAAILRPGGLLWAEAHTDYAPAAAGCFEGPGWASAVIHHDTARRPRFVEARRAA